MATYAAIIFILVTLVSITLLTWLVPNKSQRRLQELSPTNEKTDWVKTVVELTGPFAKLSIPDGKWEDSPVRLKFIQAGIRNPNAPILFYSAKTLLPLIFAAVTYLMLQIASKTWGINNVAARVAIIPISNDEAIIVGAGDGEGGVIRAIQQGNKDALFYSGYLFSRSEH